MQINIKSYRGWKNPWVSVPVPDRRTGHADQYVPLQQVTWSIQRFRVERQFQSLSRGVEKIDIRPIGPGQVGDFSRAVEPTV